MSLRRYKHKKHQSGSHLSEMLIFHLFPPGTPMVRRVKGHGACRHGAHRLIEDNN
jgi:hypothetical protein